MKKLIAALVAALASIGLAGADTYPSRSITIIVPFSAGGPTDALARTLGDRMRQTLGQPIVIENVTGAGGTIGVDRAVQAAPDGYTLSIGHLGTHVVNGAIYPLTFDLVKDFCCNDRQQSDDDRDQERCAGKKSEGADCLA